MPAGIRQIKDSPSWPAEEEASPSRFWPVIKNVGLFLGVVVASIGILTASCNAYRGWVVGIKDEARAEQRSSQIEKRVGDVESKVGEVNAKLDDMRTRQQLDQVRSARMETILEMLLRGQGKAPPPKSDELTSLQAQNGEF